MSILVLRAFSLTNGRKPDSVFLSEIKPGSLLVHRFGRCFQLWALCDSEVQLLCFTVALLLCYMRGAAACLKYLSHPDPKSSWRSCELGLTTAL